MYIKEYLYKLQNYENNTLNAMFLLLKCEFKKKVILCVL